MPFDYDPQPMPIFIGSFNINSADANSSVNVGENDLQSLNSVNKVNMNGQVYGQLNTISIQPINSHIFDPDGWDAVMPLLSSPLGLED